MAGKVLQQVCPERTGVDGFLRGCKLARRIGYFPSIFRIRCIFDRGGCRRRWIVHHAGIDWSIVASVFRPELSGEGSWSGLTRMFCFTRVWARSGRYRARRICGRGRVDVKLGGQSTRFVKGYIVQSVGVAIVSDLDTSADTWLADAFYLGHFPDIRLFGVHVVALAQLFVQVVVLQLAGIFSQHLNLSQELYTKTIRIIDILEIRRNNITTKQLNKVNKTIVLIGSSMLILGDLDNEICLIERYLCIIIRLTMVFMIAKVVWLLWLLAGIILWTGTRTILSLWPFNFLLLVLYRDYGWLTILVCPLLAHVVHQQLRNDLIVFQPKWTRDEVTMRSFLFQLRNQLCFNFYRRLHCLVHSIVLFSLSIRSDFLQTASIDKCAIGS